MRTKRAVLALLVGLNVLLLLTLVGSAYGPPAAMAQGRARAGDFTTFTAKVAGQEYDILYVLDSPQRKLYAFYPGASGKTQLTAAPARDLAKDFNR